MCYVMNSFLKRYVREISEMEPSEERREAIQDLKEFYCEYECVRSFLKDDNLQIEVYLPYDEILSHSIRRYKTETRASSQNAWL